jgi:CRISPR-associated protein Csm2
MWQEKVGNDDARFNESEPFIRMLKAKAAYAKGRGHVDANFRALFDRLIDQSTNARTLRQAKLFFEAFMAYYKVFRKQ